MGCPSQRSIYQKLFPRVTPLEDGLTFLWSIGPLLQTCDCISRWGQRWQKTNKLKPSGCGVTYLWSCLLEFQDSLVNIVSFRVARGVERDLSQKINKQNPNHSLCGQEVVTEEGTRIPPSLLKVKTHPYHVKAQPSSNGVPLENSFYHDFKGWAIECVPV